MRGELRVASGDLSGEWRVASGEGRLLRPEGHAERNYPLPLRRQGNPSLPLWGRVREGVFNPTLILILASILLLSACGFRLRGAVVLPEAMQVTTIQGGGTELRNEIRDVLQSAGAEVVPEATPAASRLIIMGEDSDRRVLSVGSAGKAREYELYYKLTYSLRGPEGAILVPEQSISMTRDYEYDPDNVLSSEQEENAIRAEMQQLAIRQMLRRVQVTVRQGAVPESVEEADAPVPTGEAIAPEPPASEDGQTTAQ